MKFYERVQLCIVDSNLNSDASIYQEQMITRVEMIPRVRLLTAYTIVHNRQQYQGSRFKYNNLCVKNVILFLLCPRPVLSRSCPRQNLAQHSTGQNTAQGTAQHSTVEHSTTQYSTAPRWQNLCMCSPILCFSESNAHRVECKWGDAQCRRLSWAGVWGESSRLFLTLAHAKTLITFN